MTQYVIKRILLFIPTLIIITIITFCVCRLAPGDPTEMKIGNTGEAAKTDSKNLINETTKKYYKQKFGLDKPLYQQYFIWIGNMLQGDFGNSFKDNRPVIDKIVERIPITLGMNLVSFFLIYLIAVPVGIYSATKQYSVGDRVTTILMFILYSLPNFWIATLAIVFLCNVEYIKIFPTSGIKSLTYDSMGFFEQMKDRFMHFFLPITI